MANIKIKDATLIDELTDNVAFPVSDGTNTAKKATIEQIKEVVGSGSTTEAITANIAVGGVKIGDTIPANTSVQDLMERILVEYQKPVISLTLTPATLLYEKGTTISTLSLSASVTKKSEAIANVKFYQGSTLLETITEDVAGGGNFTCETAITAFDEDTTFKATTTDAVTGSVVEATKKVEFIIPFYHGNSDASTISALTGLTKDLSKKGEKSYTYMANNKYLCIAYPSAYGSLTSIKDSNNFENIQDFNSSVVTIDEEEYRVYISQTQKTATNFRLTFKF